MADLSDVETTLVALIETAIYPNGNTEPSVVETDCRIYRGWPTPASLNADLAAGRINITVYPADGGGITSTRFPDTWVVPKAAIPAVTVAVSGTSATFTGSGGTSLLAGLLVDGQSFAYTASAADTPASIAANLAVLARASGLTVQVSGATLSVPFAGKFTARVVANATAFKEVRRQQRLIRITCWCPAPALRDASAAAIDVALAPLRFIDLPDGGFGRIIYAGSVVVDNSQNAALYRRDLLYSVEYATTLVITQPAMLFGTLDLNAATFTA